MSQPATFTAAKLGAILGVTPQAVRQQLRGVAPAETRILRGNECAAWEFCQLPVQWQKAIEQKTEQTGHRNPESLVADPMPRWQPPLPLEQICKADIDQAIQNREVFQPWLQRQHDCSLTADELDAAGVRDYQLVKRIKISKGYFRKLFNLYVERDGGRGEWNSLSLYLPARIRAKEIAADPVPKAEALEFESLQYHLDHNLENPVEPTKAEVVGVWGLALKKFQQMLAAGEPQKSAKRRLLNFLFARAKCLASSPDALRKAFEQRLANGVTDGRQGNGNRAKYPVEDLKRLRHSVVQKNGGRIDAAWRQEYKKLSDYTRERHAYQHKCPRTLARAVNRYKVDALKAAATSEKELRDLVGRLSRSFDGMKAMENWSVDDVTSNLQIAFQDNSGEWSLLLPQIIAVMDNVSQKILAWSISNDKGPTSRLVCAAVKKAILDFGVPGEIGLENGWVFGGSKNINGREDDEGNMIVAGLASYGCSVRHFKKRNPTSKPELENSFWALQKLMEQHPGWAGRIQMLHASDSFKKQERIIQKLIGDRNLDDFTKAVSVTKHRYTFDEFVHIFQSIVDKYNSTPKPYGRIKVSPDEAFQKLKLPDEQITKFSNKLRWWLDERYRLIIKPGGVDFTHYGKPLRVKGGELPQHIGEEFWALVDRADDSMVTFMSMDYTETFTVPVLPVPSADETRIATGSGKLAEARGLVKEHIRAIKDQVADLREKFGDTRQNLLDEIRRQPAGETATPGGRHLLIDPQMAEAGALMEQQRESIRVEREQVERDRRQVNRIAESTGLYLTPKGVAKLTPEQRRKLQKIQPPKEKNS